MLRREELIFGATYAVDLQQDWTTCTLVKDLGNHLLINFDGRLHCYGVPFHGEYIDAEHFFEAYWLAPPGSWEREYDPFKYNDHLGYPAG